MVNLFSSLVYLYKDGTSFHNEFIVNSQQLLYINVVIGLFFVLYFVFFRTKPKSPTRLNLRAKPSTAAESAPQAQSLQAERQERDAKVAQVLTAVPEKQVARIEEPPALIAAPAQKDLSIYFVYNGHEWECHDVLGIPRGSSLQHATEKYQGLIKTSDPSTFPFYEAAFDAILKKKGSRQI